MKVKKKMGFLFMVLIGFLALFSFVNATTPTTLTLRNTTGDVVQVSISGQASSNVTLSYLPTGSYNLATIAFGTTDANGNFSTSISSGGYAIPSGSPVYVSIGGVQSPTALWPSYTSSLSFSQNSVQIAVGQSLTINGSNSLTLASNSLTASIGASVSGSQITITGLSAGSGTLTFCSSNVGCNSIAVVVGAQGVSQITLSQTSLVLYGGQSQSVYVLGGDTNGYVVNSNSNSTSVTASIGGVSNVMYVYGNNTSGSAIVVVCSRSSTNNCATLNVTVLNSALQNLSFSQNNLSLIPGLSQSVTVTGGSDNNYYISSNSNSGVAGATVSANNVTVIGGTNSGSTVIVVCSATVSAKCASLNVVSNASTINSSASVLAFSQNVVTVPTGGSTNVTVTGGTGAGYSISSNSNPSAITASINGNSNVITLYGNTAGSSVISVCSATAGTTCASLYATVGSSLSPISFTQSNIPLTSVSLNVPQTSLISVRGGSGSNNFISSNSNPNVVNASLSSNDSVLLLTSGTTSGNSVLTICSSVYTTTCGVLNVTVSVPAPVIPVVPVVPVQTVVPTPAVSTGVSVSNDQKNIGYQFKKNLILGTVDVEVKELQKYLNENGFTVAKSGAGSVGKETTKFGAATKAALIKFQKANKITPAVGYFGPVTRKFVNS